MQTVTIKPQPGPQEAALASTADVVIMGGAKGGGKSWTMRVAPVRYLHVPGFHAVVFRRTLKQVTNSGGMWDKSYEVYPYLGGKENKQSLRWRFPKGSSIMFSYLMFEKDSRNWFGTETAMYLIDQLEEFTKQQFLDLLGCMRTTCGVRTQMFCTCNPDADSWLATFVEPWLAPDGYVDLDQNGTIKHFTVVEGEFTWVDADWRDAAGNPPKSATYISADVYDNKILLESDPNYLSSLMAQSSVDRERFLGIRGRGGNWKAKMEAGKVFKSHWFKIHRRLPPHSKAEWVRFWDLAAKVPEQKGDDPDYTVGALLAKLTCASNTIYVVVDVIRERRSPAGVDELMRETAIADGQQVPVRWFRDPAQAGIYQENALRKNLAGFSAYGVLDPLGKKERINPLSKAVEFGDVVLKDGEWNQTVINECVGFPDAKHDDIPDAIAGGYNYLVGTYNQRFREGHARH